MTEKKDLGKDLLSCVETIGSLLDQLVETKQMLAQLYRKENSEKVRLTREAQQLDTLKNQAARDNYVKEGLIMLKLRSEINPKEMKVMRLEASLKLEDYKFTAIKEIMRYQAGKEK